MIFNERCKIRRELLGLTMADIAKRAGVSDTTVSRFEDGAEDMGKLISDGLRQIYDRLPDDLDLDSEEKRYLRIAENAVCVFNEKKPGFRVKYCTNIIIDCGHAINELTKPKDLDKNKGEQNVKYGKRTGKVYIG